MLNNAGLKVVADKIKDGQFKVLSFEFQDARTDPKAPKQRNVLFYDKDDNYIGGFRIPNVMTNDKIDKDKDKDKKPIVFANSKSGDNLILFLDGKIGK